MADALKRNRVHRWAGARAGCANPFAKLTREQVIAIRTDPRSGLALSKALGISEGTISNIRRGISHVNER